MSSEIKKVLINGKIKSPKVRVISSEGAQLGILTLKEALSVAAEENQDLVEVAPQSQPPVCKIMDYGKFKYEQSKKAQEAKKSQTIVQVKEVKMRPRTEEHDFQYKVRNIKKFLESGNKSKVCIIFRGRELAYKQMGMTILNRVAEETKEVGVVEQSPKMEGRNMVMILAPKG